MSDQNPMPYRLATPQYLLQILQFRLHVETLLTPFLQWMFVFPNSADAQYHEHAVRSAFDGIETKSLPELPSMILRLRTMKQLSKTTCAYPLSLPGPFLAGIP